MIGRAEEPAGRPKHLARNSNETRLDAVYRQVREVLGAAGERVWPAVNAASRGIDPEVARRPEVKRGLVLSPRRRVVERLSQDHFE